ncbi:hypothetical protein MJG53_011967 [Ovis ammon polii x Ovis aries]|uniref:beta-D-galactosyl-(1->3)-N-acetyl-beta-D-galactosaminide alpha-2,3-sialyltransferase n=2 Tax=Ovis TaxID=9935 RepID=A0A836A492_SHEEP|nr:hypothetical protein JEQ12_004594 [Ovis aries]KAI4575764.1 hypothetical protein MJG53_011967 [Ovis ammon polii x Ovis aries]
MLLLWLMTPCLNLKTDSAPQEKWMDGAPRDCSCPWFKFWQCGCPSGSLNHSVCHHTAGERWFDAGYEKMKRSLMGVAESTRPGAVLWWSDLNAASELGRVWKKLLKVIPRPSVSHFDLFCGTCALMGNSKILRAASLSNNVNRPSMVSRFLKVVQFPSRMEARKDQNLLFLQYDENCMMLFSGVWGLGSHCVLRLSPWRRIPALDLDQKSKGGGPLTGRMLIRPTEILSMLSKKQKWRMNQAPVQGFEADVGKRTTVRITYPTIDSPQDPGAQLLLLPLNSSGLKWVMDIVQKDSIIQKAENPGFQIVQVTHGSNEKKDKVSVISLSFLQYVQQRWLGKHGHFPSLGFITLLYALHTCDQVSLFG